MNDASAEQPQSAVGDSGAPPSEDHARPSKTFKLRCKRTEDAEQVCDVTDEVANFIRENPDVQVRIRVAKDDTDVTNDRDVPQAARSDGPQRTGL